MAEGAAQPAVTTSVRAFEDHKGNVLSVAVSPDGRRMVTGSTDGTLRLWDLENGVVLKSMEGNHDSVWAVMISRDGKVITSGGDKGELIAWHGVTGESLIKAIKAHSWSIFSLDFSPNSEVLATGSRDQTTKLWCTKSWKLQGNPIHCRAAVYCVRYSPDGELLAIATFRDIQIWNPRTRDCIISFHAATSPANNISLVWTPDGRRLLSAGSGSDPTIRGWDSLTWNQVDDPWNGHTQFINAIAVNSAGTLVASASHDTHVRLWRLSDRRTISVFKHSGAVCCVTFSADDKHILSGGHDKKVLEWTVPEDALALDIPMEQPNDDSLQEDVPGGQSTIKPQAFEPKILSINRLIRNACLTGDLHTAEVLLTKEIDADDKDYNSYANRSVVMARKFDWDRALLDARKSMSIQPSLSGLISKGIALCGKMELQDAMRAFDLAFMFTNEDSRIIHSLLLIKAIALFNVNQHVDAMNRLQELATICPNADTVACGAVKAYLLVRLGINAFDDARHNEAVGHFADAINSITFSSGSTIHSAYEDFVVLFGWDLKSLWRHAHQKLCDALLCAGRLKEAVRAYRWMMDESDETTKTDCFNWSTAFKQNCSVRCAANIDVVLVASGDAVLVAGGDAALAANDYDKAIELYSAAIDLDSATDSIYVNRSKAKSKKMLWEDAVLDAQAAIELNPSSYRGYEVKHTALCGAQRYDEAIEVFQNMLSKLEHSPDTQMQKLRRQYVSRSEVEIAIREIIHAQLENAPLRLINTSTGCLCDRKARINAFETSTEYKELVASTTKHTDLQRKCIENVVAPYFHYVMLSHRWEGKEPLLQDIQEQDVYKLDPVGSVVKLQSFCKASRDAGYRWAWSDTCCIDKNNNAELQESINTMFVWYHHSALTIVYLSDVSPSSKSGALAKSEWNKRGWTFQEFVAPKVVLFYQKDWTLYLDDRSRNHKDSIVIMKELQEATGIESQALVAFRPGMSSAREKLQWASMRVTTLQEDIAYSLFGIFGIHLPVIYGEKKQSALGRLLQEIVAQSGDITALDWVGQSSEFNSCLPAEIASYTAPPCALPSLSEDEFQTMVSSLRNTVALDSALKLYNVLDNLRAPRFSQRRLHLPCITFPVTEFKRRRDQDQEMYFTYEVKARGLRDLLITTEVKLVQFSPAKSILQSFLLIFPWNRQLLELPDFTESPDFEDHTQSEDEYWSVPQSPSHDLPGSLPGEHWVDSESHLRALQLIARLGQPFGAFLLARQRGGEYNRIASDCNIIAQVEDVASFHNMDIRTLEIL